MINHTHKSKISYDILSISLQKELGAVYTPENISDWLVENLKQYTKDDSSSVLDPSSGDGSLLYAFSKKFKNKKLIAVDINKNELQKISTRISSDRVYLECLDSVMPHSSVETIEYWKNFFIQHKINTVISNPPWGIKLKNIPNLSLAKGQFDSYELFIEIMIKASRKNTVLSFIIPDSIFLHEHAKLRKLILDTCDIKLIARLGEGFFQNVYRGTTVLILKKGKSVNNTIECFRLNKTWRTNVFLNNVSLKEAQLELKHTIEQKRFENNSNYIFDIDIKNEDTILSKFENINRLDISKYCDSGRGVEISKSGKVIACPFCQHTFSVPKIHKEIQCKCKKTFKSSDKLIKSIIVDKKVKHSLPLIVGEDVKRYDSNHSRYILTNIKGINYKNKNHFFSKKLIVRKTGIGIKATIDNSKSLTNQVVFHYVLKRGEDIPDFLLEYIVGILSSRVMLAYYLKKYGDSEWRSHPYITQKIISELPIPVITKDTYSIAQEIGMLVSQNINSIKKNNNLDIKIENLVAKMYNLNKCDCKWVINVLKDSQQLEPIRTMLFINDSSLDEGCK